MMAGFFLNLSCPNEPQPSGSPTRQSLFQVSGHCNILNVPDSELGVEMLLQMRFGNGTNYLIHHFSVFEDEQ